MPWTTPTTWTPNQLVTASDMNAQVRDNLNYLLYRTTGSVRYTSGDKTTTSTTLVAIDSTNIKTTVTTVSGRMFYQFSGTFYMSSGTTAGLLQLAMDIDGTQYVMSESTLASAASPSSVFVTYIGVVSTLSVGAHTFTPYWKISANTVTMKASSSVPAILTVWEA